MSLISAESKEEYRSSASDDYSNNKEDSAGFASMFLMCIYEVGGLSNTNLAGCTKKALLMLLMRMLDYDTETCPHYSDPAQALD